MENNKFQEGEKREREFIEAFNNGYLMSKYEPETLDKLLSELGSTNNSRTEGLIWGKRQFEDELKMEHLNEFQRLRDKGRDKDKDFEKDR